MQTKVTIMIPRYPLEPSKEQLWKFQIIYITCPVVSDVSKQRNSFFVITQLFEEFLGHYFKIFQCF